MAMSQSRAQSGARSTNKAPPSEATDRSNVGTRPASDLERFELSEGAKQILQKALEYARAAPDNAASTSLLLFAAVEIGTTTEQPRWGAEFLSGAVRPTGAFESVRDAYLARKFPGALARAQRKGSQRAATRGQQVTSYTFATFEVAEQLARKTTGIPRVHARHLLAAMLTAQPQNEPSGAQARLAEMGVSVGPLSAAFFDFVVGYGDRDAEWQAILGGTVDERDRFAAYAPDTTGSRDLLGIEQDVRAFATLIAGCSVTPPLAIGLFGEWGSGKTFFMRQLRSAISELSARARSANLMQRDLPFYKRIVQIEFNAWHYVEGNLWASLVEHILAKLHRADDDRTVSQELQDHLIRKVHQETAAETQAKVREESAKEDVNAAERELERVRIEREAQARELAKLTASNVRRDFPFAALRARLEPLIEPLGIKVLSDKAQDLENALRESRAVLARGSAIVTPLLHARDRGKRAVYLTVVLGAPILVGVILFQLLGPGFPARVAALATTVATFIGTLVDWLRRQTKWTSEGLAEIEQIQSEYDARLSNALADQTEEIRRLEEKVATLTANYEAAQRVREDAMRRRAAAERQLEEATVGSLLARFISDRAASTDYRKHLGVLAVVRDDFETLSDFIEEENWRLAPALPTDASYRGRQAKFTTLEAEKADEARRVNRIVLYIDDLDRCPPAKVVEVLQAVHLLLAFPLFVVVVGVDARWIARSLEARYRELLHSTNAQQGLAEEVGEIVGAASSDDYLEKIFQIPYWLKPMNARATRRMLAGMLEPSTARARQASAETAGNGGGTAAPDASRPADGDKTAGKPKDSANPQSEAEGLLLGGSTATSASSGSSPGPESAVAPFNLAALDIEEAELKFIDAVAPLVGRTPRSLKRFVNVYRVIKASLTPLEQRVFLRASADLADYQAVLMLLAIDTGLPDLAPDFIKAVVEHTGNATLQATLELLEADETEDNSSDCQRLRSWLELDEAKPIIAAGLERVALWVPRVAQYSFRLKGFERSIKPVVV